ncbi:MAG: Dabb family protein [Clostridia bacterium]|nr:Dabb family protein [Clostridia bacterium]
MVKHIILWKLKDEYNNDITKDGIKVGLEGLMGKIPGLLEIKVQTEKLKTSNADVMLYSVFENEEALKEYAINPIHVKVANEKVRPFTETRLCMDFSEI